MDCHIGTFLEQRYVYSTLFGDRAIIIPFLISAHSHLVGLESKNLEIINKYSFPKITHEHCTRFGELYSSVVSQADLVSVGYSTALAHAFEKSNKPILIYNCVRYDTPYCWTHDYRSLIELNGFLARSAGKGNVKVISNNIADHDYFLSGPHQLSSTLIPTIGSYRSISYNPSSNYGLIYNNPNFEINKEETKLNSYVNNKNVSISDLGKHRFLVHFPYDATTMSVFEQYAAGIPLLFPSLEYAISLHKEQGTQWISRYWLHNQKKDYPSYLKESHGESHATWWALRADYYNSLDSVNYFNSLEHLIEIANTVHDSSLIRLEKPASQRREHLILEKWRYALSSIGIN